MKRKLWEKAVFGASLLCLLGMDQSLAVERADQTQNEPITSMLEKHISLIGNIELEAFWAEDFETISESAIELAKVELGLTVQAGDWVTGELVLGWQKNRALC